MSGRMPSRFVLASAAGALVVLTLPACASNPRFTHAKSRLVNQITNMSDTIAIVRDENLTPGGQAAADALRAGAFVYESHQPLDEMKIDRTCTDPKEFMAFMKSSRGSTSTATFPDPIQISILPNDCLRKKQVTNDGTAEIFFGGGSGSEVYIADGALDTFLEFEVSDIFNQDGQKVVSGTFSIIARNKNDVNDLQRLIIMDGAYIQIKK